MNPSLSAINQDILLSSDFFLVPTSPDFFSVMAIKSLARIIPSWEKWAKNARTMFADATYPLPHNTPKFLGFTINDFNLSRGQAQLSFRTIMDEISAVIDENLIPSLGAENMLLDKHIYESTYKTMEEGTDNIRYKSFYCLAEISNFNKLIALSNQKSLPIFELYLPNPRDGQLRTIKWFKFLFNKMADRVINLVNENV